MRLPKVTEQLLWATKNQKMAEPELIQICRELIREGKTQLALEQGLNELQENNAYYNSFLSLSNRWRAIQTQRIRTGSNDQKEPNRITSDLIDLLNDMQHGRAPQASIYGRPKQFWTRSKVILAAIIILLLFGVAFIIQPNLTTSGDQSPVIQGDETKIEYNNSPTKDSTQ